jgi:hypothetical protein
VIGPEGLVSSSILGLPLKGCRGGSHPRDRRWQGMRIRKFADDRAADQQNRYYKFDHVLTEPGEDLSGLDCLTFSWPRPRLL